MDYVREDLKLRRRTMRRTYAIIVSLVTILVFVLLYRLTPNQATVSRADLYISTVERGGLNIEVRGPGNLVPRETLFIVAESSGRVDQVLALPGDLVTSDTIIVRMSNPELAQQVLESKAIVSESEADFAALRAEHRSILLDQKAELAKANSEYESARLEAESKRSLAEKGIIPKIEYQRIQLVVDQLRTRLEVEEERTDVLRKSVDARLDAADSRLRRDRQQLELRELQLDNLRVRAGMEGVLQSSNVEVGQLLVPGDTIARIAKPDELVVEIRIAESQANQLRVGQSVVIDARGQSLDGHVSHVDPTILEGTVRVLADLTGSIPAGLRSDLSVDATILIEQLDDVLHINRPVFGRSGARLDLFRIVPNSDVAVRVPVTLGAQSVDRAQVLSGVSVGDEVIVSDMTRWSSHDRIRIE